MSVATPAAAGETAFEPNAARLEGILKRPIGRLERELSLEFEGNPFRSLRRRLMVASSGGRVGSHVLLQGLLRHGVKVNEYFNIKTIVNTSTRRWHETLEDYCKYRLEKTAADGDFGVKGGPHILIPMLKAGELPAHFDEWSVIYLYRYDVIRQAVSQFKAELTGSWRASQTAAREAVDDDFDGEKIAKIINTIYRTERTWEDIFQSFQIDVLRLSYEELAADSEAAISRVAGFAGLKGEPIQLTSPPVRVQADALNERWRDRFIKDFPHFDYSRGSRRGEGFP